LIRKGLDADLLIVDDNPTEDIQVTERLWLVIFRGRRADRSDSSIRNRLHWDMVASNPRFPAVRSLPHRE
jgi:hypothetical protein